MSGPKRYATRVVRQRALSSGVYELTFQRDGMTFRTGEEITIHGPDGLGDRTYTLLNGEQDDVLQILYRAIPRGDVSPKLAELQPDDTLASTGPHGNFLLRDRSRPIVFVATGTGIAPAVSYVRTHPGLHLTLVHGVRDPADLFYRNLFVPERHVPCLSRGPAGEGFQGRVTDWFASDNRVDVDADYYLCGSNDMIVDMRTLLMAKGCDAERIFAEPYYFW